VPLSFALRKWLVRSGLARFTSLARRLTGGYPDVLHYYSERTLAAPVERLTDPATFPIVDGPDVMNLNLPAPRFDSPLSGGRLLADRSGTPPAWGLPALRETIAERCLQQHGRTIDARTDVFITHGATAAYATALDAFINPGDRIVLFDPCSPMFALGAESRRARIRWVPTWNEDGRARFLEEGLGRAMRGAKMLVLADPANPTGGVLAETDWERIAWLANRHDLLVYLDESFGRYRLDMQAVPLASMTAMKNRLLVAGSVSQGYGLASLRVGWLTGPLPLLQACALQACLSAPYVPTACQDVALRALSTDEALFGPVREQFRERRRYTIDRLRSMGLEPSWPGGGYTTWVPVSPLGMTGRAFAEQLLRECDVLVGPGCAYGPSGTDHIRISFAAEDGRLREGLTRLAKFIAQRTGKLEPEETRSFATASNLIQTH